MKFALGCLCSAVLGSVLTLTLAEGRWNERAAAQNGRRPPAGPAFPQPLSPPRSVSPPLKSNGAVPANTSPPAVGRQNVLSRQNGLTAEEAANVAVYEKVNRSVVNITTKSTENFFLLEEISEGSGSGCVIDKQGHILTNFHVIKGAQQARVTLFNGKTYDASLVGADPINDLAVLKINAPAETLFPVILGDSGRLKVGMRVYAIGNPFGLERTMTTGIISSLNRSLKVHGGRTIRSIIQIDAAVNPGNSGGPLLDTQGALIGINTAIATRTGQNAGVGFAIPSNLIGRVVPQLIRHGRVIRPEIGILRVYETEGGLRIAALKRGGPAERAGLRGPQIVRTRRGIFVIERIDRSAADLIVAVDDHPVKTADDFLSHIESRQPGDRVVLTILRQGKKEKVEVTLGGGSSRR